MSTLGPPPSTSRRADRGRPLATVAMLAALLALATERRATGQSTPSVFRSLTPSPSGPRGQMPAPAGRSATLPASPVPPAEGAPRPPYEPSVAMAWVPGTRLMMGSIAAGAEPNEGPPREVTVTGYWLDATEVTVGAYRACVASGACRRPRLSADACTYHKRDPRFPMNCVGFDEADRYCMAAGKRLPTEAEWEVAARRGHPESLWPWGPDALDCSHAVALTGNSPEDQCSPSGPLPVAKLTSGRSADGVFDLAGNVEEWVSDYYDDRYPSVAFERDPHGPAAGYAHVLRGGGWLSHRQDARVTARSWGSAAERGANVGFRCAKDAR